MVVKKKPATDSREPPKKRTKRVEGLYEKYKGKSIPEPKVKRLGAHSSRTFKAVCWNVGGLRALLANRGQQLQKLVKEERPSLLGILEHKLQEGEHVEQVTQTLKVLLPEYDSFFSCSKVKKGYSGTAVLLRRDVVESGAKVKFVQLERGSDEGRTIVVETAKLFVVICYVMNSGDGLVRLKERLEQWDPKLRAYLVGLSKKKPVLLLGDLNVAHRNVDIWNAEAPHVPKSASTTPEERKSFGKLLGAGFVDGFVRKHYETKGAFTYWSIRAGNRKPNRGLRLDYVVVSTSMVDRLIDAFHLPAFAPSGDHCPVGAIISQK